MFALAIVGMVLLWAAIIAAVISYFMLSWGFVLTKLWSWFLVVPFGLAAITFSQAIAIMIILGTIKTFVNPEYDSILKINEEPKEGAYPKWTKAVFMFMMPWLSLLITWLVKIIFIA
jgi:hypothetical protein